MEEFVFVEPGYSDSISPISEPPDIANWFSSYVYESFPSCSLVKESESGLNELPIEKNNENIDSREKFHKPIYKSMNQKISDRNLSESLPSEPPDISNWFSSYVYESQMLDTSDGLEFSVPGVSECKTEKEKIDRNSGCPKLLEQELDSSPKVTDFSHSQSLLSEPLDVKNWFSSYEYQSPQLSDTHELELGLSSFEKDKLIIEESDTEEENSFGIFRKIESKQQTSLNPNDYKDHNIAVDKVNEVSSNNTYSDQEMKKKSSVGLFNASKKETIQESSFEHESLFSEPKQEPSFSLGVYSKIHELKPEYIQETILSNSNREKLREENQESIDQELNDKENVHRKSTETGFVTMKKARDRCSMTTSRPNTEVLLGCSSSKELKNEENKEDRKKKRRVLGEMSNHQFPKAEEIAGKWSCPQKRKGNSGRPLKQLRLNVWIHKV